LLRKRQKTLGGYFFAAPCTAPVQNRILWRTWADS